MLKIVIISLIGLTAFFSVKKPELAAEKKKPVYEIKVSYDSTGNSKDTIVFKKNTQLTWNDFKGKPQNEKNVAAISSVGFKYNANISESDEKIIVNITISSFFVKPKSWKKSNVTDYILQHEQLHFDLARIAAQELKDNLQKRKIDKSNFDSELSAAYKEVWQNYRTMQQTYDEATNHSLNKTAQAAWDVKIKLQLANCLY